MSCPSPHPLRVATYGIHPDLEVIGSYAPDSWVRCRTCGRWWWLTTDESSKWQYCDEWEIDANLATRALVDHDVAAAAQLLVTADLPRGPVWTTSSALVEMLRAITPGATDDTRSRALSSLQPKGRWADAATLLAEIASKPEAHGAALPFSVDLNLAGRTFSEAFEVGDALVLLQSRPGPALVRIDARAVTESQAIGPVRSLARADAELLYGVTPREGVGLCRIDADGTLTSQPPRLTQYVVTSLDDGFWLFTPDDGQPIRYVEMRRPDAQPRVKLRMGFARRFSSLSTQADGGRMDLLELRRR